MKDSRVMTLNTKGSKYTNHNTASNENALKIQPVKALKSTEDENTDNQAHHENVDTQKVQNNQDTVQIISMSQKNTPIKKKQTKKFSSSSSAADQEASLPPSNSSGMDWNLSCLSGANWADYCGTLTWSKTIPAFPTACAEKSWSG